MSERMSAHTRTVLNVLSERRCHLTAEEILARSDGIGTATVYRALDHLTESGRRRLAEKEAEWRTYAGAVLRVLEGGEGYA